MRTWMTLLALCLSACGTTGLDELADAGPEHDAGVGDAGPVDCGAGHFTVSAEPPDASWPPNAMHALTVERVDGGFACTLDDAPHVCQLADFFRVYADADGYQEYIFWDAGCGDWTGSYAEEYGAQYEVRAVRGP